MVHFWVLFYLLNSVSLTPWRWELLEVGPQAWRNTLRNTMLLSLFVFVPADSFFLCQVLTNISFWSLLYDITKAQWKITTLCWGLIPPVCWKGSICLKPQLNYFVRSFVACEYQLFLSKRESRVKNLTFLTLRKHDRGVSSAYTGCVRCHWTWP